tara:strand:+ start:1244 stop:3271 length:2028 start_codon:yes stop_codon:yes gene_type:complete
MTSLSDLALEKLKNKTLEEENINNSVLNFDNIPGSNDTTVEGVELKKKLTMTESAMDPVLSFSNKFVGSAVQILDLPFMLFDAIDSGKDFAFKKIATTAGMSEADADEIINYGNSAYNIEKFRPGEWINKNILNDAANYEAKTPVGETVGKMGEYIPYALLAPTTKAKAVLSATGAASGLIDQAATKASGSDAVGMGVGVGANILLDILAIRKGKIAGLVDDVMPDKKTIDEAKKLQEYAKKYGLDLTTGEATQLQGMLKLEGATTANLIGNKVLDTFWKNRPNQLKNFIRNWGKENGLLPDSGAISSTKINEQVQKVAIELSTARSQMWLKSGGAKFNKSFFDSQLTDNLRIELLQIAKESPEDIKKYLIRQADIIKKSKGSGDKINKVYQDLRDGLYDAQRTGNTVAGKSYNDANESVKKLLSTNEDWIKANKKYKIFSDTYEKPLSKGSVTKLFNDLKDGRWQTDAKTNATLYKYITSNDVRPADIEKMVASINKSGVEGAWQNIASDFFNSAFNKAAIDNMNRGLNTGNNFYNAILKTSRNKENFTEVMFQLAKQTDKNVKRADIKKAVTSFANVLKASTAGGKSGSSTLGNINVKERLESSPADLADLNVLGIKDWFKARTLTKSSAQIAESLVSKEGIDAFLNLAQNWKDGNKAVVLLRTLTIGSEELE